MHQSTSKIQEVLFMNDTIEQQVIETIANTLKIDKDKISLESAFIADLKADSLDLVEVMMAFEAAFGHDISDEDAGKIVTVADAVNYIKAKNAAN